MLKMRRWFQIIGLLSNSGDMVRSEDFSRLLDLCRWWVGGAGKTLERKWSLRYRWSSSGPTEPGVAIAAHVYGPIVWLPPDLVLTQPCIGKWHINLQGSIDTKMAWIFDPVSFFSRIASHYLNQDGAWLQLFIDSTIFDVLDGSLIVNCNLGCDVRLTDFCCIFSMMNFKLQVW